MEVYPEMINISVILLNWNGLEDTFVCLRSLYESEISNFRLDVVVVDNASDKDPTKEIKQKFPGAVVIRNNHNLGFAGGNNIGIKEALKNGSDLIFLLNNDTKVDTHCIKNLLDAYKNNPQYSIMSPKIYFEAGFEFHKDRYSNNDKGKVIWYNGGKIDWQNMYGKHVDVDKVDDNSFSEVKETEFATGAAILIKSEVFKTIGLLDENYFLYYEDTDFCERAKRSDFKIAVVPKALVWHKNAASSSSGSNLQSYYIVRNRLFFGFKYAPFRTKLALTKEAVRFLIRGNKAQKQGVFDFFTNHRGKHS